MKKLLILLCASVFIVSCKSIQTAADTAVNCKYTLIGAEARDFSLSNVTMDVMLAVTNQSKKEVAKVNRFEGRLYINGSEVSDIKFGAKEIMPGNTDIIKTSLDVPFSGIGKNLIGLVTTNSISLQYKIAGRIYFDTPLGEVPFPIVVEQKKEK